MKSKKINTSVAKALSMLPLSCAEIGALIKLKGHGEHAFKVPVPVDNPVTFPVVKLSFTKTGKIQVKANPDKCTVHEICHHLKTVLNPPKLKENLVQSVAADLMWHNNKFGKPAGEGVMSDTFESLPYFVARKEDKVCGATGAGGGGSVRFANGSKINSLPDHVTKLKPKKHFPASRVIVCIDGIVKAYQ